MLSLRHQGSPRSALNTATYLVLENLKGFATKCQVALGPNNRTTKSQLIAITLGINSVLGTVDSPVCFDCVNWLFMCATVIAVAHINRRESRREALYINILTRSRSCNRSNHFLPWNNLKFHALILSGWLQQFRVWFDFLGPIYSNQTLNVFREQQFPLLK